jgi:NMD protein affecting ribosome stability and mRNA decay
MKQNHGTARRMHHDFRHDQQLNDPYYQTEKPPEPTQCPKCHSVFTGGRWTWETAPKEAHAETCPACRRIEDRFPAGYILIKGEFFNEHREDIINLVKARENRQKAERPLQRIMGMDETRDGFEITTTDSHLARGIAEALHDAYKGDLKVKYSRDENLVRAVWKREMTKEDKASREGKAHK